MTTTARALLTLIPHARTRTQIADLFEDLADRYGFEAWVADPYISAHLARIIASAYRGRPSQDIGIALATDLATIQGLRPTDSALSAAYDQAAQEYTAQAAENTIGVLMGMRGNAVPS